MDSTLVVSPRADLLGETKAGELVNIELQSGNAKDMAIRMLEYGLALLRKYHSYPTQVLLYVGEQHCSRFPVFQCVGSCDDSTSKAVFPDSHSTSELMHDRRQTTRALRRGNG